jgi:hypothetical protein
MIGENVRRMGRSRTRRSRRVIIELGFSPEWSGRINHLSAGRSFGEGQAWAAVGKRRMSAPSSAKDFLDPVGLPSVLLDQLPPAATLRRMRGSG